MEIKNVILHNLIKEEKSTEVVLKDRSEENEINDSALQLSKEVNEKFNSTGINTGYFEKAEEDEQPTHFEYLLKKYYNDGFDDFVSFTRSAAGYLKNSWLWPQRQKADIFGLIITHIVENIF